VWVDTCESKGIQVLSFHVRGFDMRWHEVLLLVGKYAVDAAILLETGDADLKLCCQLFSDFSLFVQKGENKNGGVLILVRTNLYASRVKCDLPNVYIAELQGRISSRILSVYAPTSRSWTWEHLSQYISKSSVLFGDLNVDLDSGKEKASRHLAWADEFMLVPFTPSQSTSFRSDRTIDYALSNDPVISLATHSGGITSDHLWIIAEIENQTEYRTFGSSTHWKVFNSFSKFTFTYWDRQWSFPDNESTYHSYTRFHSLYSKRDVRRIFP
jgi:hypothetical protein